MYKKTTLNNGLTVVTHRMSGRVSVSLGIWVKVGARYEQKGINGISHFLEHLLFKGTQKRTCEQIKQSIEGIGGALNAFTGKELTCYLAKVPSKYLDIALDVLGDMVLNAILVPPDIEKERKVILEEIRMYKDLPGQFVMELLAKLLWPKQPLGRSIAGETKSVEKITRSQLLNYRKNFYQLDNVVVVACGDVKHQQVLEQCKRYLSSSGYQRRHKSLSGRQSMRKFLPAWQKQLAPQLNLLIKDTEQTHLSLGLHGLSKKDPERFIFELLHIILGANMSSRLFREVREERGLAYEIGTILKFFQDTGAFVVHAGIDNCRVLEALEVIMQQLAEIKKTKVKADELQRAKEYYIGQLMLALEDTSDHMLWLGENFISLNRFLYPQEIIRRIKRVKVVDLQHLAHKILQNCNLNLAIIGPLRAKDKKSIKQRLTF
jgi:predicted Zn-dependent peptidase